MLAVSATKRTQGDGDRVDATPARSLATARRGDPCGRPPRPLWSPAPTLVVARPDLVVLAATPAFARTRRHRAFPTVAGRSALAAAHQVLSYTLRTRCAGGVCELHLPSVVMVFAWSWAFTSTTVFKVNAAGTDLPPGTAVWIFSSFQSPPVCSASRLRATRWRGWFHDESGGPCWRRNGLHAPMHGDRQMLVGTAARPRH